MGNQQGGNKKRNHDTAFDDYNRALEAALYFGSRGGLQPSQFDLDDPNQQRTRQDLSNLLMELVRAELQDNPQVQPTSPDEDAENRELIANFLKDFEQISQLCILNDEDKSLIRELSRQGMERIALALLQKSNHGGLKNLVYRSFCDTQTENNPYSRFNVDNPSHGAPKPIEKAKHEISNDKKLKRYLLMGDRIAQDKFKKQAANYTDVVEEMIKGNEGPTVVSTLVEVSERGNAPTQDGLLSCLAVCLQAADLPTRQAAWAAIQKMCNIPTHWFQLMHFMKERSAPSSEAKQRKVHWGRGLRSAICTLYNSYAQRHNGVQNFAMHVTKYMQRHGWSHRDVIRLCHVKPKSDALDFVVRYVVKGMQEAELHFLQDGYLGRTDMENVHKYLKAVEEAKVCAEPARTAALVLEHRLVREHLNTEMLNHVEVWGALLKDMPVMALVRNLSKMTNLRLFDNEEHLKTAVSKLTNKDALRKARVHPLKLLIANHQYRTQQNARQRDNQAGVEAKEWKFYQEILDALDKAFYLAFEAVQPTNKRILVALDISGSMNTPFATNTPSCMDTATALCMVMARTEPNCDIVAFSHVLTEIPWLKDERLRLEGARYKLQGMGFGGTDCSLPMLWAMEKGRTYDAFVIFTDCETNAHRMTPAAALRMYRKAMEVPTAKLVVAAMVATNFSIADPADLHMFDIAGFDPDTPTIISEAISGGME